MLSAVKLCTPVPLTRSGNPLYHLYSLLTICSNTDKAYQASCSSVKDSNAVFSKIKTLYACFYFVLFCCFFFHKFHCVLQLFRSACFLSAFVFCLRKTLFCNEIFIFTSQHPVKFLNTFTEFCSFYVVQF